MAEPSFDYQRIMAIVAHPDDVDFLMAGSAAKWSSEGREINYVLCTSGDTGTTNPDMSTDKLASIREQEQRAAADVVGVKEVVFLRYPDNTLQNTISLRKDIVRQIRRLKPEVVVCGNPLSYFTPWGLNHPDHRASAAAALEAVFPSARDYHSFPDLIREGFPPHNVQEVLIEAYSNDEDFVVDVSGTFELKLSALKMHESQVGTDPARLRQFEEQLREGYSRIGIKIGVIYAEPFKRISIL